MAFWNDRGGRPAPLRVSSIKRSAAPSADPNWRHPFPRLPSGSLYKERGIDYSQPMNFGSPVFPVIAGLIALIAIISFVAHFLTPEARLERRRRRNSYRVVSKARRPMVTLNVRARRP